MRAAKIPPSEDAPSKSHDRQQAWACGGDVSDATVPLDDDQNIRLSRELRDGRELLLSLLQDLPRECRAYLEIRKRSPGPRSRHPWSYERILTCCDRLVEYAESRVDERVSRHIDEVRRLQARVSQARESMIEANLGMVTIMARQAFTGAISIPDLIQEGYLGLLKAIDRFDPEHGTRFSTYASWWVRRALNEAFDKDSRMIRLPVCLSRELRQLRRARTELQNRLGRSPTDLEIADWLGISLKKLDRLRHVVDEPALLEDLGDPESSRRWSERLPSGAPGPLETTLRDEAHSRTRDAVCRLSPRERVVIRLRFGFDGLGPLSLEKIGQLFGVSRERVRQIEAEAMGRLRRWFRSAPRELS